MFWNCIFVDFLQRFLIINNAYCFLQLLSSRFKCTKVKFILLKPCKRYFIVSPICMNRKLNSWQHFLNTKENVCICYIKYRNVHVHVCVYMLNFFNRCLICYSTWKNKYHCYLTQTNSFREDFIHYKMSFKINPSYKSSYIH